MSHMNSYHHLSPEERAYIMLERERGRSLRQIAMQLGRSPATISREVRRNSTSTRYCANGAGKSYRRRRLRSVRPRKIENCQALLDFVQSRLTYQKWSPEQIAATLKVRYPEQPAMHVSPETIYAYIYTYPKGELKKLLVQSLRRSKSKRGLRGSKNSCYSSL